MPASLYWIKSSLHSTKHSPRRSLVHVILQQKTNTILISVIQTQAVQLFCSSTKATKLKNISGKGKVHPRTGHEGPELEQRYSYTLSLTSALDAGGWSMPRPSCFTPANETQYPLYSRLGGPQGQSEKVWKISPPTGIRSLDCPARSKCYQLSYFGPH